MTKAISSKAYQEAAYKVKSDILKSTSLWYDEIQAFQIFIQEADPSIEMPKIKERWDQLIDVEK